jgi:hypothetical protein
MKPVVQFVNGIRKRYANGAHEGSDAKRLFRFAIFLS